MTWEQFMDRVNDKFADVTFGNVSPSDIEDYDYRGSFEAGEDPEDVAMEALVNAGWDN